MYSQEVKGNVAKACNYNARVSTKSSKVVCKRLRGMELKKAKKFLEDLQAQKRSIDGKYYTKVSIELYELIGSAEKNAEFKNLDTNNMFVAHVASQNGTSMRRRRHKSKLGNRIKATHLEIILKERAIAGAKPAPKDAKKEPVAKTVEKPKKDEAKVSAEDVKEAIEEKAKEEIKSKPETKKEVVVKAEPKKAEEKKEEVSKKPAKVEKPKEAKKEGPVKEKVVDASAKKKPESEKPQTAKKADPQKKE